MLRKMTITLVVGAMLSAVLATMPARANSSFGIGVAAFDCNITILFPQANKNPAKTNCTGDAYGAAAYLLGAKQGIVSRSVGSLDPKDNIHNFQAYNVEYNETCIDDEPLPLIGFANGHAIIASNDGSGKRIHAFFEWTRVGDLAEIILYNVHSEFGGLNKAHKSKKDGTPLGKGNLTDRPDGVAYALFDPKPPVGSCVTPNPQQAIRVVGEVVAVVNVKNPM